MEFLKSVGGWILGVGVLVIFLGLIGTLISFGGNTVVPFLLPFLSGATGWLTLIFILALPLGFFRKTRGFAGLAYYIGSYLFAFTLLCTGFLLTFYYWGVIGVIIGALMLGIGVVATGILASLFHADWWALASLVYLIVLTYGARMLGAYWASKADEDSSQIIVDVEAK